MTKKKDFSVIETVIAYVGSFACFIGLAICVYCFLGTIGQGGPSQFASNIVQIIVNVFVLIVSIIYFMKGYRKKDAEWYRLFLLAFAAAVLAGLFYAIKDGANIYTILANAITAVDCIYLAITKDIGKERTFILLGAIALIFLLFLITGDGVWDFSVQGVKFIIALVGLVMAEAKYVDKEKRHSK